MRLRSVMLILTTLIASSAGLAPACAQVERGGTPQSAREERSTLPDYPAQAPPFVPGPPMPGTLRVWGNDFMVKLESLWEQGFQKYHPEITFADTLKSSAQAVRCTVYGGR